MKKLLPLIALLLLPSCSSKEVEYQGRTVTAWVAALEDPNAGVKTTANNVLKDLASKDKGVYKALINGMKNGNYAAADLLGQIGKDAGEQQSEIVLALGETVRTKGNLSVRLAAARALPRFGIAAGSAIPALIDMLKDESAVIREMAAETIGKLPENIARQATPALLHAAKHDVLPVQHRALETLRTIDPEALKKEGGL